MKNYRRIFSFFSILIILVLATFIYLKFYKNNFNIKNATLPEQIVFAKSDDNILNAGVIFNAKKEIVKPIAVIIIHGWGVNFYSPTYISIGRDLAERGYTCFAVNTRMHDIGNVEGYKGNNRIRGGGYWGIASDEVRDLAAWIDFAELQGFERVILVGHSAGWSAARMYQAEKRDKRIVGLVSASGEISPDTTVDSLLLAQALPMMTKGEGEGLIKIPDRSFPSYISAASFMDYTKFSPEQRDFFGFNTPNSAITRIECPILVFFGTNNDIGDEAELESLKSCIKKQPTLKSKVTTTMIKNADHMYGGEEGQVASVIIKWMEDIQKKN